METKQKNFNKGEEGEKWVAENLSKLGYKVIHVGGATKYSIDGGKFWCSDLFPFGKGRAFWVQVKNKEPRKFYPDTGLEYWRFENLKWLQKESGKGALILFTDNTKKIYGEWVKNLKEEKHGGEYNALDDEKMIYFWLKDLKGLADLLL